MQPKGAESSALSAFTRFCWLPLNCLEMKDWLALAVLILLAVGWNLGFILFFGKYPHALWILGAVNVLLMILAGRTRLL